MSVEVEIESTISNTISRNIVGALKPPLLELEVFQTIKEKLAKYAPSIPEDGSAGFIAFNAGTQRMKIKTGRFIAKKLELKDKISDEIIQKIAGTLNEKLFDCIVRVSKGKAITEHYSRGTGGNSCMAGSCSRFTLLYKNNPDRYSMLTIETVNNTARAMLIKLDNGKFLLDRVYATDEFLKNELQQYAKDKEYFYRKSTDAGNNEIAFNGCPIRSDTYEQFIVSDLNYCDGEVPFQDTLANYKITDNCCLTITHPRTGYSFDGILNSTTGGAVPFTCEQCGCSLSEDECFSNGGGDNYCGHCYSEIYAMCENCNEDYLGECMTTIHYEDYCDNCRDELFTYCECCDEYALNDNMTGVETGDYVCLSCLENYYTECRECNQFVKTEDIDDNTGNCSDCQNLIRIHKG